MKASIVKAVTAFGRFWWDFLIGDTPELAVATAVIVGAAYLAAHLHVSAAIVLPVLAALFLLASSWRGRRRAPETPAD
jgi:hypothetical protein